MLDAQCVSDEALVCLPFRFAQFIAQDAVQAVVAAADGDVGVAGFVRAVGDYGCYCARESATSFHPKHHFIPP